MEKLKLIVNELKNVPDVEFNEQNFYTKANETRYQSYLHNIVLGYATDIDIVKECIKETPIAKKESYSGIYQNNDEISCIVPTRDTIFDEMKNIHEITHLVNFLSNGHISDEICKEVIPFFNEYDYLRRIHPFYAEYYEKYRFFKAINSAKALNEENADDNLPYIYAYLVLEHRKRDYDIQRLNQCNIKHGSLKKALNKKGYTIDD